MHALALALIIFLSGLGEPNTPAAPLAPAPQEVKAAGQQEIPSAAALVATFTKYEIAVVRKGPKWTKDSPAKVKQLYEKRQKYWKSMIEEGKLLGVAKAVDPKDVWGLLFFKIQSADEMKTVISNAPALKEGLLAADIRTVWGSRGLGAGLAEAAKVEMPKGTKGETYYLAVMQKGPKWSDKADAPETREATTESMQYLYGLYKEGSLRYFASVEDMSMKIRSVAILKAASADEALKMIKAGPAVKKGWHIATVHAVTIPDGIIP